MRRGLLIILLLLMVLLQATVVPTFRGGMLQPDLCLITFLFLACRKHPVNILRLHDSLVDLCVMGCFLGFICSIYSIMPVAIYMMSYIVLALVVYGWHQKKFSKRIYTQIWYPVVGSGAFILTGNLPYTISEARWIPGIFTLVGCSVILHFLIYWACYLIYRFYLKKWIFIS